MDLVLPWLAIQKCIWRIEPFCTIPMWWGLPFNLQRSDCGSFWGFGNGGFLLFVAQFNLGRHQFFFALVALFLYSHVCWQ
jgi:hypothetical protein